MPRNPEIYSFVEDWRRRWEPEMKAIAYNGVTCDPTRVDPKVLQWVKQQRLGNKPHFVKIINSNAAHGRPGLLLKNSASLSVPTPFVRDYYRQLDRVVILETTTASDAMKNEGGGGVRKWRVSFGAPKKEPQWLQGWRRVAADNNFQVGDVVVFVLVEPSRFRFTHFDADGNLRKCPSKGISVPWRKSKHEFGRSISQERYDDQDPPGDREFFTKKNSISEPLVALAYGPMPTSVINIEDAEQEKMSRREFVELDDDPMFTVSNIEDATMERKLAVDGQTSRLNDPEDHAMKKKAIQKSASLGLANGSISAAAPDDERAAPRVEIPIPAWAPVAEPSIQERTKQGKPNSEVPHRVLSNPVATHNFADPSNGFIKSQWRPTTGTERQRAKQAAMATAQSLDRPHFVTVLSNNNVNSDFHLVVPEKFATEVGWYTPSKTTRVKVDDGSGKCWDMHVKLNTMNEVAFHRKHWALFALHHMLEEGDVVCMFLPRPSSPLACNCSEKQHCEHVVVRLFRAVPLTATLSTPIND